MIDATRTRRSTTRVPRRVAAALSALALALAIAASAATGAPEPLPRPQLGEGSSRGGHGVPAAAVLERLGDYVGHWRSEEKTGREGGSFHFELDLSWFDPDHTILAMLITRIDPAGKTVVFEGFKGLEPAGGGVYYFAASPSGRSAHGRVVLEEEDLVTAYDGWTSGGAAVRIRDVFEPIEDGTFVSRTFLRESAEAEWRQIGEDHWRRTGPAS